MNFCEVPFCLSYCREGDEVFISEGTGDDDGVQLDECVWLLGDSGQSARLQ